MTFDIDVLVWLLNGTALLLMSFVLAAAVVSPYVRDGVVIKTGMSVMCLGFFGAAFHFLRLMGTVNEGDFIGIARSIALVCAGAVGVLIGAALRVHHDGTPLRRRSDWMGLDGEEVHR